MRFKAFYMSIHTIGSIASKASYAGLQKPKNVNTICMSNMLGKEYNVYYLNYLKLFIKSPIISLAIKSSENVFASG